MTWSPTEAEEAVLFYCLMDRPGIAEVRKRIVLGDLCSKTYQSVEGRRSLAEVSRALKNCVDARLAHWLLYAKRAYADTTDRMREEGSLYELVSGELRAL